MLRPAASPSEALERATLEMGGDEAKYRQVVLVKSPHRYSEAFVRYGFAAAGLHRAVLEHDVTGERMRDAGFDRHRTLSPSIPAPQTEKERDGWLASIQRIEWEVDGNVARPKGKPDLFSGGTQGPMSIERVEGGWVVVIRDPVETGTPEQLRQFAQSWSAMAAAIDATTEQVNAGKLRTFVEVNDYFDAQMKAARGK